MIPANFKGSWPLSTLLQTPQAGLPGAMTQWAKRLTESGQEVWRTWRRSGMMGPRVQTKKSARPLHDEKHLLGHCLNFEIIMDGGAFQHVPVLFFF